MDKNYQQDLEHIRKMMERSSRFMSLSGLSGVFAGLSALLGALYVYFLLAKNHIDYFDENHILISAELLQHLFLVALTVLATALMSGYFFTARKTKAKGQKIWDLTTKRLMFNFSIPLISGGIVCLALLYHNLFVFIAPMMLILYGLGLVMASQYTLSEIKYLGLMEIGLGILSLFFLGYGLLFWGVGFGVLHIVYGIIMYKKYD